jgi:hypothetical protein
MRQVEPAACRVFLHIAQYVGELKGAAERIGDILRLRAVIAENFD